MGWDPSTFVATADESAFWKKNRLRGPTLVLTREFAITLAIAMIVLHVFVKSSLKSSL